MMTFINFRKYINPAFLVVVVIVLMFVSQIVKYNNADKNAGKDFSAEVFKTKNGGFGYLIKLNDLVIIKQEIIPAISKNVPFNTGEDALKTAGLVVQKIKNKKVPSVTVHELDSMDIKY